MQIGEKQHVMQNWQQQEDDILLKCIRHIQSSIEVERTSHGPEALPEDRGHGADTTEVSRPSDQKDSSRRSSFLSSLSFGGVGLRRRGHSALIFAEYG